MNITRFNAATGNYTTSVQMPGQTPAQPAHSPKTTEPATLPAPAVQFGWFWNRNPHAAKLMKAIQANNTELVQKALDKGADINQRHGGAYPLMKAVQAQHPEMVTFLLEKGAKPNLVDGSQQNALMGVLTQTHRRLTSKEHEIINILAPVSKINLRDANGFTALNLAAKNGHDDMVGTLLAHGADATIADIPLKMTPLMYAAWRGKPELALQLIQSVPRGEERRAYLNARSHYRRTALDFAQDNNRDEVAALLLQMGAQGRSTEKPGGKA